MTRSQSILNSARREAEQMNATVGADALLNAACEWLASHPRRLAVFIAAAMASPFIVGRFM